MGAWECCEGAPWNPMVDDPFPYLCNCWEQIPFSDPRFLKVVTASEGFAQLSSAPAVSDQAYGEADSTTSLHMGTIRFQQPFSAG